MLVYDTSFQKSSTFLDYKIYGCFSSSQKYFLQEHLSIFSSIIKAAFWHESKIKDELFLSWVLHDNNLQFYF